MDVYRLAIYHTKLGKEQTAIRKKAYDWVKKLVQSTWFPSVVLMIKTFRYNWENLANEKQAGVLELIFKYRICKIIIFNKK